MSGIQRIQSNRRMSQAVVHAGIVYLSGQVDLEGVASTVPGQMHHILGRIDALLAAAHSHKSRLLSATIWLRDISDFEAMNGVCDRWLDPDCAPARATVQATLARPHLLVEIAVTAAVIAT